MSYHIVPVWLILCTVYNIKYDEYNLTDQRCRRAVTSSKYPTRNIFLIKKIYIIVCTFFFSDKKILSTDLTGLHYALLYTQTTVVYDVGTYLPTYICGSTVYGKLGVP